MEPLYQKTAARVLTLIIFSFFCATGFSQQSVKFLVKAEAKEPLAGTTATIPALKRTAVADSLGLIFFDDLPAGRLKFVFSFTGFETKEITINLPTEELIEVEMEFSDEHEEEIIVRATRTSRTIYDIPTRVEIISGEELDEKSNMKPGDIRMLLNESTGIQTQQTSATSYNSGIRIQGLDGRYTQLLRDGYPLYGGFSGSLSLLQIIPLDLKQVEVIKGSVSTLYGGGAIAGLVNLVSKTPGEKRELNFLANGTSARGYDLSGFYSEKFSRTGMTLLASVNHGSAYDPAGTGLTAIPQFDRYTLHPRFFIYGKQTTMDLGVLLMKENRLGGSMDYIKNGAEGYFEKNNTERITANWGIEHALNEDAALQFKSSFSYFDRLINIPGYQFEGVQKTFFSELNYSLKRNRHLWIAGINYSTDAFEENAPAGMKRDYSFSVPGIFLQNSFEASEKFSVETGIRTDHNTEFGTVFLPRISFLYRPSGKLTMRLGGGRGYKLPGIFTEETERLLFRDLLPLGISELNNEKSAGGNFDLNYRTLIGEMNISFNQLFFYTRINRPVVVATDNQGDYYLKNATGHIDTKGMETNLKMVYDDIKLFVGYTYTNANANTGSGNEWLPLTARHRLNNVLMFEKEDQFRVGLEGYYFGSQKLSDGSRGSSYWIFGLMGEKTFDKISVFLNFENFTDTRQTKMGGIYTGTIQQPVFREIFAPVDGFVVNGGLKLRL